MSGRKLTPEKASIADAFEALFERSSERELA